VHRGTALALTATAAVLWGTSFPANDLGLRHTDPWTFMAARFVLAALATGALAWAWGALDPRWFRNRWVWAVALTNALSYQVQFLGQDLTSPGAASLMVNAGNLTVPLWAWLVHRERLAGTKGPAFALATLGVLLVGTRGDPAAALASSELAGNLLTLAAGVAFALVIVLQKAALGGAEGQPKAVLGLVAAVIALTALLSLPGALLLGSGALPPMALAAAGYTALFTTTIAFALWTAALTRVSSVTSGLLLFLEIVVAFALSVALGLEVSSAGVLAGAACILAAIALVSLGPVREAPRA
jgi:drug/metabolite transporter (DMT)-like permease